MRISTTDKDGKVLSDIFTKTLTEEKAAMIANFNQIESARLLEEFPSYKQINAALGVYSDVEKGAITTRIQQTRTTVDDYETAVNACTTFDQLKNI